MQTHPQWEHFECRQCGRCCTEIGLPYESRQVDEIARFLGLTANKVIERYYGRFNADRQSWVSEHHKRTPCPFMTSINDKKACAIYPVRPKACRQFPFEDNFGPWQSNCPGALIALEKQQQKAS
jgi:Fe-S-cluster containining protein